MIVYHELVRELTDERGQESQEATLRSLTSKVDLVARGRCWPHRVRGGAAIAGYVFCTKMNRVIDLEGWRICQFEIADSGQVKDVLISERFPGGCYYLDLQ